MSIKWPDIPDKLSENEWMILNYFNGSNHTSLMDSIHESARTIGVSTASLSRFVRRLGFDDYKEFKQFLFAQYSGSSAAQKMANTWETDGNLDIRQWLNKQSRLVQTSATMVDPQVFSSVSIALARTSHVYIYGAKASTYLAEYLSYRLHRIGIATVLLGHDHEIAEDLVDLTKDDVIIIFGFSKLNATGSTILSYGHTMQTTNVLITSCTMLPQAKLEDYLLTVDRGQANEFHSMTSAMALLDGLVVSVGAIKGEPALNRMKSVHHLKQQLNQSD